MRLSSIKWLGAATAAILLHGSLLLAWQTRTEGASTSPPPGPSVALADAMASVMGVTVELQAEPDAPKEITSDEPVEAVEPVVEPVETAAVAPLELIETVTPKAGLPTIETAEPKPVETAVISPPKTKPVVAKERVKKRRAEKKKKRKKVKSEKRGKGEKRASKRGTNRKGRTGTKKRSGGRGKGRASAGQIASFKARVRSRIAGCVRSRVSGRGAGRVVIRFGVNSGGGARGVSASGTASLRSIAASAARGCSFPRPPRGAAGLRFSFPVSVR